MKTLTKEAVIEVLKKRVQNLIASDLISPFFWEDFADEIIKLESLQEDKPQPTDEEIEEWAKINCSKPDGDGGVDFDPSKYESNIEGAKAMRGGLIPHKE